MPSKSLDPDLSNMCQQEKEFLICLACRSVGLLEFGPAEELRDDIRGQLASLPDGWVITRMFLEDLDRDLSIVEDLQDMVPEMDEDEEFDEDEDSGDDNL